MTVKAVRAFLTILFAAGAAGGGGATAADFAGCVRGAAARDLAAKTDFQRGLRDLIARNRPEFAPLATLSMELQVAFARSRRAMIDYLLVHDRDRIDTAHGLARFTNFAWSDGDSARLAQENRAQRDRDARIAALRAENDGHPQWPELRAYYRSELAGSADFRRLTTRLQAAQNAVAAAIARCRKE